MSSAARDRADAVAEMPHVRRWIERFRKLAAEMPPEVWVFVGASTPTVMAAGDGVSPIFEARDGGMDQDAIVTRIIGGRWDGGDW